MKKESERAAAAAPLDQVKQSVHSDLQYVSLQVDGKAYGGWYRMLPDGQMELLALANMHCERRAEDTPIEQARGMLADFIRAARTRPKTNVSTGGHAASASNVSSKDEGCESTASTLGALLYADKGKARVPEQDWVRLIQSVAAGDQLALHRLFERTHRIVFTLLMRLTHQREAAEELTLDVFQNAWRKASEFDAAKESVVGWIMNQARSRASDGLQLDMHSERERQNGDPLPDAITALTGDERQIFEALSRPLWERLARRIAAETGEQSVVAATRQWTEPSWEEVAPGIECKLLATDTDKNRVSMLVRLAPGVEYPPHRHGGVEELHLLHGELWIDDRKLHPGDYNRAEPGTADKRVWSEAGCACVLITSTQDTLD